MPDIMQASSTEDALPPTVLAARALLDQMGGDELAHMFYVMLSKVRDHNIKNADASTQLVISFPKTDPFKTPAMSDDIQILKIGMSDSVRMTKLYEAEFRRLPSSGIGSAAGHPQYSQGLVTK